MSNDPKDEFWFPIKETWIFEENLWYGVLEQATEDLFSDNEIIQESAYRWFINNDIHINSFCGICMTLNVLPEIVRASILKKYRAAKFPAK